jgi:LEA14-like dessication related protein
MIHRAGTRFVALVVFFTLAAFVGLVALSACSKPQPPQLTPQQARVTSVDMNGFDMTVKMDAFNPNAFELSVQSVSAHVLVDGNQDLGTVTASKPIALAANAHSVIDVPMNVKWKNAASFAAIATSRKPVLYTVDGTATVGGKSLNVDVPFKLQGTMTAEQLQQAGLKSLQAIPGLQGLPGMAPPK